MNRLNLGSGPDYREECVNVDINPEFDPDRVINLEEPGWDLETDTYQLVYAYDVFEHIDPRNRPTFLQECHRVLAPDGRLIMSWPTPGFGGGWDVTHYTIPSWDWPEHPKHAPAWHVVDTEFTYSSIGKFLPKVIAEQLMWHGIRTIISVELVLTTDGTYPETW